jgi:rhodanese-related sulfurtransferase
MRTRFVMMLWALVLLALAGCTGAPGGGAPPAVDPAKLPATVSVATVKALQGNPDVVILDVRTPEEYKAGRIPGITLIPMDEVPNRLAEIPKDKPVIVTCRTGNRSSQVAKYLREQGYTNIHNMEGGIVAWEAAGYPVEK